MPRYKFLEQNMKRISINRLKVRTLWFGLLAGAAIVAAAMTPASAQQQQKPNILFIMGDDIGLMQVGAYHRGWSLGETPNIDRISRWLPTLVEAAGGPKGDSLKKQIEQGAYPAS
jgi:hypothetical protein